MLYLKGISLLPKNITYYVYGSDEYTFFTRKLLSRLRLDEYCLGTLSSLAQRIDERAFILVSDKNWAAIIQDLERNGVPDQLILLLIYSEGNLCGPYDFWNDRPDEVTVNDSGTITVNLKSVVAKLLKEQSMLSRSDKGEVRLYSDAMNISLMDSWHGKAGMIFKVATKLMDALSKTIYMNIFTLDFKQMVDFHSQQMFKMQKYVDCTSIKRGDVILYCGVGRGSEIPPFLYLIGREGQLHCVDPLGFQFLCEHARKSISHYQKQVFLHEVALSENGTPLPMLFDGENMDLRRIIFDRTDDCQIQVCPSKTIDQLVADIGLHRLDLITVSMVGSEFLILNGLVSLMEKFRTQVVICISYLVNTLWEIPLFFMEQVKNYHFIVRHYSFGRYETYLYMIPDEKMAGVSLGDVPMIVDDGHPNQA